MTVFNPVEAAELVTDAYLKFLESAFSPRRAAMAREYATAIKSETARQALTSLILEPRRTFVVGARIQELVADGVLHPIFSELVASGVLHEALYDHQERAIRAAVDDVRNVVIATGTGSGKTEAFLLPIVNGLVREYEAGVLTTGVRAILLYPMNALANDQMVRIREIFRHLPPTITFGRYIGATKHEQVEAERDWSLRNGSSTARPANELISREVMDRTPPHLLLTNYAMLERMLLLPKTKSLFSPDLQWLALDEVHTYDGARGTEMAFLLRRLRQRTAGTRERVQCFAASATLGDGESSAESVAKYASELFDEPFYASAVITPRHLPFAERPNGSSPESRALVRLGSNAPINLSDPSWAGVSDLLRADPAALPVRYHQLVRSPAGAFICLAAQHPVGDATPRITLESGRNCRVCDAGGVQSRLFELAACRSCGSEYLRGRLRESRFEAAGPYEDDPSLLLLGRTRTDLDSEGMTWSPGDDIDDDTAEDGNAEKVTGHAPMQLCTSCLRLSKPAGACVCGNSDLVDVFIDSASRGTGRLDRCLHCGYAGTGFGPVSRAVGGADALSAVLASSLYAATPAGTGQGAGEGRKLLIFSDSRQDAAYFAPFLKIENDRLLRRRLVIQALRSLQQQDGYVAPWETKLVADALSPLIAQVFPDKEGNLARQLAFTWLRAELIPRDTRQSLEGVGLLWCGLPGRLLAPATAILERRGVEHAESVIRMLVDTLRLDGAVGTDNVVDPSDAVFAPLTVEHSFVCQGKVSGSSGGAAVHRWIGSNRERKNRRTRILRKALDRAACSDHEVDVLQEIWDELVSSGALHGRNGRFNVPLGAWTFSIPEGGRHFCEECRRWTWYGGSICPTPSCAGVPRPANQPDDYWRVVYTTSDRVRPMEVMEHTAQWTSEKAEEIQRDFVVGKVNVLSGSTTFEMGVDVGEVQAVFCRNVPPTPANYIQRAGRAGRREGAASLVVTLARTRSHDAYYAANPDRLVMGAVPVPMIDVDNVDLARRHVYALALSTYLSETDNVIPNNLPAKSVFESTGDSGSLSVLEQFAEWLRGAGRDRVPAADIGLSDAVMEKLGIPEPATWIDTLTSTGLDVLGPLGRAQTIYNDSVEAVHELQTETAEQIAASGDVGKKKQLSSRQTALFLTLQTLQSQDAIGLLANNGVLPKYGFPIDVVGLYPVVATSGMDDAREAIKTLDLTRDLRLALREYAPGNEVMAGGDIIKSVGVKTLAGRALLTYAFVMCDHCDWFTHQFAPPGSYQDLVLPQECGSCHKPIDQQNVFIEPEYGFVGEARKEGSGSRRPVSKTKTRVYLSYTAGLSEADVPTYLSPSLSYLWATSPKLLTLSTSPALICLSCGYVETDPKKVRAKAPHRNYRSANPAARCSKELRAWRLGHIHGTELLEIRLTAVGRPQCTCGEPDCGGAWRSLAAALAVGGARLLRVSAADIDAEVTGGDDPRVLLYDTAAGGAGYAKAMKDRVPELLRSAFDVVANCTCTLNGSCYQCLRNYQNQSHHEHLSRAAAMDLLTQAIDSI